MSIDMNQNDMDRYFWRTGQRWSGDDRPEELPLPVEKRRARIRTIWFLFLAFLVTVVMLFLLRLSR
jgi:hypothetical protein